MTDPIPTSRQLTESEQAHAIGDKIDAVLNYAAAEYKMCRCTVIGLLVMSVLDIYAAAKEEDNQK